MSKLLTLAALVALSFGCRSVSNKTAQTFNFNAKGDIVYDSRATQDATQAADKEVGDIAPETSVTPK